MTETATKPKLDRKPRGPNKPKTLTAKPPTPDMAMAVVTFLSLPVAYLAPDYALTETEKLALGNALYDAACSNVYIAAILQNLTSVGGVGELVAVTGALVGKRVAYRIQQRMPEGETNQSAVGLNLASEVVINAVASRRAPTPSGVNRERKDNASSENTNPTAVRDSATDEGGYPQMEGMEGLQDNAQDKPRQRRQRKMDSQTEV